MYKSITIVIPSYNSKKLVLLHLKKLSKKLKILIIENSQDNILKKLVNKKYKNAKVYFKKNIGYGRAINFASTLVKTKYFFVMNPDTKIYKDTLKKLYEASKRINKFGMLCPQNIIERNKKEKSQLLIEKKMLNGAAMLFDKKYFKKIGGFDEKIFLYYEENDYFRKSNNLKLKLYTVSNSFHYHDLNGDTTSAFYNTSDEKDYSILISGWHGQWSKFYFNKKYEGYFKSLLICLPNLVTNILQLFLNLLINFKKTKYIYFKIEGLIASMIGLSSFKRSKYDKLS